ncbi:MAG: MBL fold metallo-hydrolase [Anaerolineales bacterium]|nr:MBL fold metallo-hydrolase [Anaerolineales bacterium]
MVQHERVADNVYMFQSEVYAHVTSGVIAGPDMAVVIDTLAYPEETLAIRDFVEQELQVPVRYVINTHYHADHTWGNCFFPGATILSSALCRQLLEEKGIPALESAKSDNAIFRQTKIVLPQVTFESGELGIQVGKKTLRMFPLPGHSADGIGVFVESDRVLFAGDVLMSVPYLVDGDIEEMTESLKTIGKMGMENVVQGHGDIILRGEIEGVVKNNRDYLAAIKRAVRKANRRKYPLDLLDTVDVESCGKGRVLLGGLAPELHRRNLIALYRALYEEDPLGSEEYFVEE